LFVTDTGLEGLIATQEAAVVERKIDPPEAAINQSVDESGV